MPVPMYIPPAGVSAVSAYPDGPVWTPTRPPGILADLIDPATGEVLSLFRGDDPVDAAVIWQFRRRHRAGPLTFTTGNRLGEIRYNDASAPRAATFEVLRIMQPFVDRGEVADVVVQVAAGESSGDLGAIVVDYRNVRRGQSMRVRL